jgi:acetyl esterase/lipase
MSRVLSGPDEPIESQRQAMDRLGKLPRPRTATSEDITLGGVRCMRLTPTTSVNERHVLYFHGGGYTLGSPESHAGWVQSLAVQANAVTDLVDYRLAPEDPYPAAIDDCVAAYRSLIEQVDPSQVVLAGDSAGGNATLATLVRLRDAGDPLPAAAVVFSPWTDLTSSGESMVSRADVDPMIDPAWINNIAVMYHGATPADDPGVSPLFADLSGLPPMLVQVGDDEVLLDDSTRLVDAIRAAGGQVELDVAPGMWHVYQALASFMPEAKKAIKDAAEFMANHTSRTHINLSTPTPTSALR